MSEPSNHPERGRSAEQWPVAVLRERVKEQRASRATRRVADPAWVEALAQLDRVFRSGDLLRDLDRVTSVSVARRDLKHRRAEYGDLGTDRP